MQQMREIRTVYRADESVVAEEEFPALTFEESLTAPDEEAGPGHPTTAPKARPTKALSKPSAEDGAGRVAVLQIASFREPGRAEYLVRELRKKGYPCFHSAAGRSETDGGYCRVYVGPLPSGEEAVEVKERLEREEGYKDILVRSLGKKEENF
jgi:cell division septation protein DedD